jgi:hypothetical protein
MLPELEKIKNQFIIELIHRLETTKDCSYIQINFREDAQWGKLIIETDLENRASFLSPTAVDDMKRFINKFCKRQGTQKVKRKSVLNTQAEKWLQITFSFPLTGGQRC